MRKLTLTVGIAACNEEQNIEKILRSIINQKANSFILKAVIVVSDGSDDATVKRAKKIKSKLIKIVVGKKRLSKPIRINQIFSMADTDVVVIFDADIKLSSNLVLEYLLKAMLKDKELVHTSGKAKPFAPKFFSEKIAFAGMQVWDGARYSLKDVGLYSCEGSIRGFRKSLYKKIIFPKASADEAFSYLYVKSKNLKYCFVPEAVVYFELPKNLFDYAKQMKRFLKSSNIQSQYFSADIIKDAYVIGNSQKIKSLVRNFFVNPIWITFYLFFIILPRIMVLGSKKENDANWEIIKSTKVVR